MKLGETTALTAENGETVLDPEVIAALRELGQDDADGFIAELAAIFTADARGHMTAITAAAEAGDIRAIEAPAHTLKSTCANIGAARLSELARRLEEAAHLGTLAIARELLPHALREFDIADAALRRLVTGNT